MTSNEFTEELQSLGASVGRWLCVPVVYLLTWFLALLAIVVASAILSLPILIWGTIEEEYIRLVIVIVLLVAPWSISYAAVRISARTAPSHQHETAWCLAGASILWVLLNSLQLPLPENIPTWLGVAMRVWGVLTIGVGAAIAASGVRQAMSFRNNVAETCAVLGAGVFTIFYVIVHIAILFLPVAFVIGLFRLSCFSRN